MARSVLLGSLLAAVAGCQVLSSVPSGEQVPAGEGESGVAAVHVPVRPEVQRASAPPPPPVREDPEPLPDHLARAADCLDRGDDAAAVEHLTRYVSEHPDQIVFRAHLADLLARLDRLAEAQAHLEHAAATAQDGPVAARERLVRYHTRLMELARDRGDDYAEKLNRGIGLALVADRLIEEDGDASEIERVLFKAAAALREAQENRPEAARPAWYLYRVWTRLDQPRPAERALRKAAAAAPFSDLTPAEARELALASRPDLVAR